MPIFSGLGQKFPHGMGYAYQDGRNRSGAKSVGCGSGRFCESLSGENDLNLSECKDIRYFTTAQ